MGVLHMMRVLRVLRVMRIMCSGTCPLNVSARLGVQRCPLRDAAG